MLRILIFPFALLVQMVWAQPSIIPLPVSYEAMPGVFRLGEQLSIDLRTDNEKVSVYTRNFRESLNRIGFKAMIRHVTIVDNMNQAVVVTLNKTPQPQLGTEGYTLKVQENEITLNANQAAGIFNGFQTLRQMLPVRREASAAVEINCCSIVDYPRFGWRGLMLDVSRHFFSTEDVKSFINQMAQYKLNVFHWHLTDDEGWRVEIKSLPKLTEVGAWRVVRYGRFGEGRPYPHPGEQATYGGFYRQEEIRDIVRYAADRNITIVPEIDVPGHSMAALAAHPELSTKKEPKFVNPGSKFAEWYKDGTFKMLIENTLNPADEHVYDFLDKVFTELASLFPGQYIHVGGDECYQGYWKEDAGVQAFMKKNNIKDTHELQSYFVKRVEKIVSSKGKKLIGWDEILEGGLAKGAAVMSWRGEKGGIEAAKMGHNVVMTPQYFTYLDYTQGDHSVENPIYADLSLEKAYSFEPIPKGVDSKFILGGQGNLWTEVIPNLSFAYYMTYPRAFAIAETLWSPSEKKNWADFVSRTEDHISRFDIKETNISKAIYDPIVTVYKEGDKLMCSLRNPIPTTEIYYTVDNTYPVRFGSKYTGPFEIPVGDLSLRARTFRNGKVMGREIIIHRTALEKRVKP